MDTAPEPDLERPSLQAAAPIEARIAAWILMFLGVIGIVGSVVAVIMATSRLSGLTTQVVLPMLITFVIWIAISGFKIWIGRRILKRWPAGGLPAIIVTAIFAAVGLWQLIFSSLPEGVPRDQLRIGYSVGLVGVYVAAFLLVVLAKRRTHPAAR